MSVKIQTRRPLQSSPSGNLRRSSPTWACCYLWLACPLERFDMGDVDQLDVVSDLDPDSVSCLGDDFIGALVLRVERWFDSFDLDVDPTQVGDGS